MRCLPRTVLVSWFTALLLTANAFTLQPKPATLSVGSAHPRTHLCDWIEEISFKEKQA